MTGAEQVELMAARWRAPSGVTAVTTLRRGGVSEGPFAALNMAGHVGDDAQHVAENRRRVREALQLPAEPSWLRQVHGVRCVDLAQAGTGEQADGAYTDSPGRVCAVLTADCLPLFIAAADAGRVGLFHVGWKGLAAGMVEQALSTFVDCGGIHCWLGPSIGPAAFEVGPEVRDALLETGNHSCFAPSANPGRWMADLYRLVAHRLRRRGVHNVSWDEAACTYSDADRFFSYRRSGECGRMASLIWIESPGH